MDRLGRPHGLGTKGLRRRASRRRTRDDGLGTTGLATTGLGRRAWDEGLGTTGLGQRAWDDGLRRRALRRRAATTGLATTGLGRRADVWEGGRSDGHMDDGLTEGRRGGRVDGWMDLRPVRLPRPLPAPAVAVLPCSVKTKRRFKERETRLTSLDIEMSLHLAGHTAARGTSSTAEAPVGHWLSRTSTARTSGASGRAGALQCTCVGFETTKT